VYISPFWEDNFTQYVDMVGADRVVFGSDWPHAEGMRDPLNFVDDLAGLPQPDIEKIMGGNMMKLFKVEQRVTA
jgi:predicted TIM-barrel fold metal-dependent hydrolase